ncbi:palmitoyltransferase pfa4 [Pseudovirgaria hyperparasitica]|uniref:Palmitoyltransferase PFA4 n=1 Tax=Pseudovirgaria hyperparasitica TaxID=470096 RepID=A0A6A6VVK4_9PEZI|nr:palmitoyltransferase pfa4 [Pseudovirgaria hyperparasitica]KAF2754263.1 palmitoyltransferase pfa4 [Pseudovirgaria hyperparasitica]
MAAIELGSFAIPAVLVLIFFLAYTSQILFLYLEPRPLNTEELLIFNGLLICLLISYARACATDPGGIPKDWDTKPSDIASLEAHSGKLRGRWCRRCEAFKPPRAHHCKTCGRCIPKMDHHCPWTANCVSFTTFPHFMRFLVYAVAAMSYLMTFIWQRGAILWENRHLPSYYGPSPLKLAHLFVLVVVNTFTLFALSILLIRVVWSLAINTTTIEGWEIERHETLLRRARYLGGYLTAPDGSKVRIVRQEFPYDIGIFKNIAQGMNTWNIIAWFWPFSATPKAKDGVSFEENGFEDAAKSWPPPDPDRVLRSMPAPSIGEIRDHDEEPEEMRIQAFRQRQEEDMRRRRPFRQRIEKQIDTEQSEDDGLSDAGSASGEEGWKNSEGERLRDFGVDEDVEFYDEDDLPLSVLMKRRRAA